jgi:regulator of ribonuclease activity B
MECNFGRLLEMFDLMNRDGLNTGQPLKWGFFFMDSAVEPLRCVLQELEGHDYQLERLEAAEDGTWVLAVSKCEVLNAEKLHRRNEAFNKLAEHCGAEDYDGWDVGRIDDPSNA